MTTFAESLNTLRITRNISQVGLAIAAGLDHSSISRLESGDRRPSRHTIAALCLALEATEEETRALHVAAGFAYVPGEALILRDVVPAAPRPTQRLQRSATTATPARPKTKTRTILVPIPYEVRVEVPVETIVHVPAEIPSLPESMPRDEYVSLLDTFLSDQRIPADRRTIFRHRLKAMIENIYIAVEHGV